MKKLLISLAVAFSLATVASADIARVEMGVGAWIQTPTGDIAYSKKYLLATSTIADVSNETSQTEFYAWVLVKHPVPVLPNLRLEYVSAVSEGDYVTSGSFAGFTTNSIPSGDVTPLSSTLTMTQIDVIPYYNILDNTFWVTIDLGLDIKVIELDYTAGGVDIIDVLGVDVSSVILPLGYARLRVQAPGTNFGVEADVKYITYDGNTVSDIRVKVDYTLDFIPVVQPAFELGYRMQTFELEDGDFSVKNDYAGVYVGLMARF